MLNDENWKQSIERTLNLLEKAIKDNRGLTLASLNVHRQRIEVLEEQASQASPPAMESPTTISPSAAVAESTPVTTPASSLSGQQITLHGLVEHLLRCVEYWPVSTASGKIHALGVAQDMLTCLKQGSGGFVSQEAGVKSPSTGHEP